MNRPPTFAIWLLRRILVPSNRDFIVDDLTEEYCRKSEQEGDARAARRWFWRQVAASVGPSVRDRLGVGRFPLAVGHTFRDLIQDVRFSLRILRKSVGFTVVAVLTLAIAIGANTAVFTGVNGILLRPLPYPDQDRLVTLWSAKPEDGRRFLPSFPDYESWKAEATVYDGLAFVYGDELIRRTEDGLDPILAAFVTGDFFPTLGASAVLGSPFAFDGNTARGDSRLIVLKHRVWKGRFGGDPDIIGRTVSFNDGSYTVAAVMSEGVDYPVWADVWTPITPAVIDAGGLNARDRRVDTRVLGRLRTEADMGFALAELRTIATRLETEYPATNTDWTVGILPLKSVVLDPWGQNENLRRSLFVLLAAVVFVLLIACANIANLMLARAVSRSREMAVRTALGASRWRLMRQSLTESLVLAVAGAALGAACAQWGLEALLSVAPPLPRLEEIAVDGGVLAYTTGVAVVAALLFGIAPAVRGYKLDTAHRLKDGAGAVLNRLRSRHVQVGLVVSQVALALVLLIGAGLLTRSLHQLSKVNLGFNTARLISVRIRPPLPQYVDSRLRADLYRRLLEAVETVPGVESASLVNHTPGGGLIFSPIRVEGVEEESTTGFKTVAPGYFETMGISVVEGTSFSDKDMTESTDRLLINQPLARFFDIQLGDRITVFKQVPNSELGQPISGRVAGIVGATRVSPSQEFPYPDVFVPYTVNPWMHATIVARSTSEIGGMGALIRDAVLSVEPEIPGVEPYSVADQMFATVAKERFAARIMGSFALAALLLAAVGIYGVLAYIVKQRTPEIGLRLAVGASGGRVVRLIVGRAMWMVGAGALLGVLSAFGLTRFLGALLFDVGTTDGLTYLSVTAVLVVVAFAASYIPARQASRVDPLKTLRSE